MSYEAQENGPQPIITHRPQRQNWILTKCFAVALENSTRANSSGWFNIKRTDLSVKVFKKEKQFLNYAQFDCAALCRCNDAVVGLLFLIHFSQLVGFGSCCLTFHFVFFFSFSLCCLSWHLIGFQPVDRKPEINYLNQRIHLMTHVQQRKIELKEWFRYESLFFTLYITNTHTPKVWANAHEPLPLTKSKSNRTQ